MNRLGMLVEISRLAEPAMMMTLHTAKAPVLFSNAAPLYLCNSTTTASIPDHILGFEKFIYIFVLNKHLIFMLYSL